ncbi:MAG TPA: nucleoside deaminase [Dongiaceae bacterium]|jgi:tRNA(Arg) A34 adenosine deaminase TadA|nr:nucleoside deaminase [Dongiaceae bacterium]
MSDREQFMRRAIAISGERMRAGLGGPFGAVVVMDGKIVAEGFNQVTSSSDPTAHAEVVAIRQACSALGRFNLEGCELYSSCEPCPMCLGAIYWARLDRVYFANDRSDAARIGFDDDHIYREFAKPMHERHLEFIHMPMNEARAVFQEWVDKPDKVRY